MLTWILVAAVAVAVVAAAGWIAASRFAARVVADCATIRAMAGPVAAPRRELPPLLADYLARTGLADRDGTRWFRVEQVGAMRTTPAAGWSPFTAEQLYAVAAPAFVWHARFRAFRVVDSLVAGRGRLQARVFGAVPVVSAAGVATTRAQLLRYLAEVAWVPRAVSHNPFLSWQQRGPDEVLGAVEHGGERVELRLRFDAQGDIVRVEGQRERSVGRRQVPTPWVGRFGDYGTVGGVRVPRRAEVQWVLDSGPFTYWRGRITRLAMDGHGPADRPDRA